VCPSTLANEFLIKDSRYCIFLRKNIIAVSFFAIVYDETVMLSCVHQAHFNRMRVIIVLERSLASCVCSHDISSPEADALWPRLTPLGDTGLHRQTCIFTVQMIRRQERAFSSYVSENTNEIKKSVHDAQIV